jgi:hypothetical protein
MIRNLAKRVTRAEDREAPPSPVPHVLRVHRTETTDDAKRRFVEAYPNAPRGHALLIVPERDVTAEDDADFERRFKTQQRRLQANARSANPKDKRI